MKIITVFILFLLVATGFVFAALNAQPISINYYLGIWEVPLALFVLLTLFVGVLLGLLVALGNYLRLKKKNHSLRRELKAAQKETEHLRMNSLHEAE